MGFFLSTVARRIMQKQEHEVELDECRVRVWAGPVELLLPSFLEVRPVPQTACLSHPPLGLLSPKEELAPPQHTLTVGPGSVSVPAVGIYLTAE